MVGGAVLGLGGGWLLLAAVASAAARDRHCHGPGADFGLALFGLAQVLGTSGFLAVYLAGMVIGATEYHGRDEVANFYEGVAWLAQIVLFLMLGLLVTPHELMPFMRLRHRRRPGADRDRTPGRRVRLPAAVPLHLARVGVRLMGRIARRSADLYQLHSGAG